MHFVGFIAYRLPIRNEAIGFVGFVGFILMARDSDGPGVEHPTARVILPRGNMSLICAFCFAPPKW